jgi:hydrogenase maturation protease
MKSVTVVGIGNEFRGDDSVAIFILRILRDSLPRGVKVVELSGDQSNLVEVMQGADNVIIIDAACSPAPAGTIFQINASEEPFPAGFFTASTHNIDLGQSIELARTLKRLPGSVLIYGIVGKDFSFTQSLSEQVREAAETVSNKILNDVDRILSSDGYLQPT